MNIDIFELFNGYRNNLVTSCCNNNIFKTCHFFKCVCAQKKLKVSFQVKYYNNSSFWHYFYFSLPQDEDNNCKYKKVIKNVIYKPYKSFENLSLLFLFLNKQLNLSKHLLNWIFFFYLFIYLFILAKFALIFFLLPEGEDNFLKLKKN